MRRRWFLFAPLAILGMVLFIFIGGEGVKLLWNWLLPPLFGWREIAFWQAVGILALCRILFGGLGWRGSGHSGMHGRMRERMAERMGERMGERWERMTPEERERFWKGVGGRCGFTPPPSTSSQSKGQESSGH